MHHLFDSIQFMPLMHFCPSWIWAQQRSKQPPLIRIHRKANMFSSFHTHDTKSATKLVLYSPVHLVTKNWAATFLWCEILLDKIHIVSIVELMFDIALHRNSMQTVTQATQKLVLLSNHLHFSTIQQALPSFEQGLPGRTKAFTGHRKRIM